MINRKLDVLIEEHYANTQNALLQVSEKYCTFAEKIVTKKIVID